MAFLIKEKFNFADLVPLKARASHMILLAGSEEDLLSLHSYYLANGGFLVAHCRDNDLHAHIRNHNPDLLIIHAEFFRSLADLAEELAGLRNKFRALPMVTVGDSLSGPELGRLMAAGISGHIDRKLTHPRDVVEIVKVILYN